MMTGHVSPQFHVVFDDLFETLRPSAGNVLPESEWQIRTGLRIARAANVKTRVPVRLASEAVHHAPGEGLIPSSELRNLDDDTDMEDPIAFTASSNPDIMYLDQAMKEPDSKQFEKAMIDEVKTHTNLGNWDIILRSEVPEGTKVLPAVWAMRRKRKIATGEAYKWKARLNLHGGKQERGVNYWETYSPVIAWTTIRLFLVLALMNGWKTRQVDFVLAFPQADIECPMYMEIPRGFKFKGSRKTHCLALKKNL